MFASYRTAHAIIKDIQTIRSSHHNLLGSEAAALDGVSPPTHGRGNGTPRAKFPQITRCSPDFWYVTDNALVAGSSPTLGQCRKAVENAILGYFPHTGA
jgi:hypothetical protein